MNKGNEINNGQKQNSQTQSRNGLSNRWHYILVSGRHNQLAATSDVSNAPSRFFQPDSQVQIYIHKWFRQT
jgi:hypothetical protein